LTGLGTAKGHKANVRNNVPVERHVGVDVAIPSRVRMIRKATVSVRTMQSSKGGMHPAERYRDLRPLPVHVNHTVLVGKILLANHSSGLALDDRVPKDNFVFGLRDICKECYPQARTINIPDPCRVATDRHVVPYMCRSRVFSDDIDEQLFGVPVEQRRKIYKMLLGR
jgi:hypothetical protein